MAELKRKEGELTTAELVSYGVAQKQPDGPKLVKGPRDGNPGSSSCSLEAHALVF